MDNKTFSIQFESRTKQFAIDILKLSAQLPASYEGRVIRNQISKSGTSIGANYREANRAKSKADFKYKIKISEGEASETLYWLEIIEEMQWLPLELIKTTMKEAKEILAIFTSISKGLNEKKRTTN
ncbi:MAG: four helix bundle protein [Bacteroidales bacterium]|jgi:four helix bundle protein|nr:four helix bundle protein [Bacteroidales bacterium]MDD4384899.1 four helix bundle protein [Bacteroidales bacterium]MDY0196955.1 four helix bundle protein [Tenuifilaceae bacterium]